MPVLATHIPAVQAGGAWQRRSLQPSWAAHALAKVASQQAAAARCLPLMQHLCKERAGVKHEREQSSSACIAIFGAVHASRLRGQLSCRCVVLISVEWRYVCGWCGEGAPAARGLGIYTMASETAADVPPAVRVGRVFCWCGLR